MGLSFNSSSRQRAPCEHNRRAAASRDAELDHSAQLYDFQTHTALLLCLLLQDICHVSEAGLSAVHRDVDE